MVMVMGASPTAKLATCCGTLSSRIRKFPLGILGMKCPLLSSTATSTLTVTESVLNTGTPCGISFLLNFEGIFSLSGAGAGVGLGDDAGVEGSVEVLESSTFFLGRATVSLLCVIGPCSAKA